MSIVSRGKTLLSGCVERRCVVVRGRKMFGFVGNARYIFAKLEIHQDCRVAVKTRITSIRTLGVSQTLPSIFIHYRFLSFVESFVIDPLNYLQSHVRHILLIQTSQILIYQQSLPNLYHPVFEVMFCSYHTTASERQIFFIPI